MHRNSTEIHTLLSVSELEALYEKKRQQARKRILDDGVKVTSSGFVDTNAGAVLTCAAAIEITAAKSKQDAEKSVQRAAAEARKAARLADRERKEREKADIEHHPERLDINKAEVYRW